MVNMVVRHKMVGGVSLGGVILPSLGNTSPSRDQFWKMCFDVAGEGSSLQELRLISMSLFFFFLSIKAAI